MPRYSAIRYGFLAWRAIACAEALGYTHRDLPSQAWHDAYFLARVCPTAMIFTPCRDGITHHPDELTTRAETVPGVEALLHAALALANA